MMGAEAMLETDRQVPRPRAGRPASPLDRLAAAFILTVLAVGCFALWLGVPAGAMWLASKLTDSFGWHMPVTLALVIPGMLTLATGLAWVNRLYLRVTGGRIVVSRGNEVRRRGPLEPMLIATLALAFCALAAWFFLFAENPSLLVW